ncbi:MAG: FAD-binding protein [Bacteroidales bacterium]|nr:FAD-binding protein [Bacteroidales bacterium]
MNTTEKKDSAEIITHLSTLTEYFEGDIYADDTWRILYATDASAYREMPQAVARPKNKKDLKKLIAFANKHHTSLIPRTAGTSLAGQVVGGGIVVDVSKYMTEIIAFNEQERWIKWNPVLALKR